MNTLLQKIKNCSGRFRVFLFHLHLLLALNLLHWLLLPRLRLTALLCSSSPLFHFPSPLSSLYCSVHARGLAPALQSWTFQPRLHPPLHGLPEPTQTPLCPSCPSRWGQAVCAPQVCLCWIINLCDSWSGQLFSFHAQQCGKCSTDLLIFRSEYTLDISYWIYFPRFLHLSINLTCFWSNWQKFASS